MPNVFRLILKQKCDIACPTLDAWVLDEVMPVAFYTPTYTQVMVSFYTIDIEIKVYGLLHPAFYAYFAHFLISVFLSLFL